MCRTAHLNQMRANHSREDRTHVNVWQTSCSTRTVTKIRRESCSQRNRNGSTKWRRPLVTSSRARSVTISPMSNRNSTTLSRNLRRPRRSLMKAASPISSFAPSTFSKIKSKISPLRISRNYPHPTANPWLLSPEKSKNLVLSFFNNSRHLLRYSKRNSSRFYFAFYSSYILSYLLTISSLFPESDSNNWWR